MRSLRLSDEFIASVDEWVTYHQFFMTRSEAIRQLVEIGLKKTMKAKRKK